MSLNPRSTCPLALLLLAGALAAAQPQIQKLSKISGHAMPGAHVALYGPATGRSTTVPNTKPVTDVYQFTGVAPGTYTVRPSISGCTFNPAERTVTVTNADVSGVDFAHTCSPPGGRGRGPDPRSGK
jgi:hypothetical protein